MHRHHQEDQTDHDDFPTPLDAALSQLYRYWSETAYCTGWMDTSDGRLGEFEEWLRDGHWMRMRDLKGCREDLTDIRAAWDRATAADR